MTPVQEKEFYASLHTFHVDELLGALYQFITIFISNTSVLYKNWS